MIIMGYCNKVRFFIYNIYTKNLHYKSKKKKNLSIYIYIYITISR